MNHPKNRAGRGSSPFRQRPLIPRRVSVSCALVSSQRVKGQMEPGLEAVPSTLRTLRQHLDSVPQVGPQGWPRFPQGIVWQARGERWLH